jgi:predicted small integral membrane protein
MSRYLSLLDIQMKQISESTNEWGASENKGLLRVQTSVATVDCERMFISLLMSPYSVIYSANNDIS